jgi:hypothetical protein
MTFYEKKLRRLVTQFTKLENDIKKSVPKFDYDEKFGKPFDLIGLELRRYFGDSLAADIFYDTYYANREDEK